MPWDLMKEHRILGIQDEMDLTRDITQQMMEKFVKTFDDRFAKLSLISEATWLLLKEHTDLTEADLKNKITELDLMDGKLDGKHDHHATAGPIEKRPECDAAISKKFNRCLFCGYKPDKEMDPFNELD